MRRVHIRVCDYASACMRCSMPTTEVDCTCVAVSHMPLSYVASIFGYSNKKKLSRCMNFEIARRAQRQLYNEKSLKNL